MLPPLQPRSLILELFGLQGLVGELEESGAGRYLMSFTGTWPVGACMQEVCSICVFPSGSCHPFKHSLPPTPPSPEALREEAGQVGGKEEGCCFQEVVSSAPAQMRKLSPRGTGLDAQFFCSPGAAWPVAWFRGGHFSGKQVGVFVHVCAWVCVRVRVSLCCLWVGSGSLHHFFF